MQIIVANINLFSTSEPEERREDGKKQAYYIGWQPLQWKLIVVHGNKWTALVTCEFPEEISPIWHGNEIRVADVRI